MLITMKVRFVVCILASVALVGLSGCADGEASDATAPVSGTVIYEEGLS